MSIESDPFEVSKAFQSGSLRTGMALQRVAGKGVTSKPGKVGSTQIGSRTQSALNTRSASGVKPAPGRSARNAASDLRFFSSKQGKKFDSATGKKKPGLFGKAAPSDPFGLEELAKNSLTRSDASTGRKVTAVAFAPYHGLVAGKKGHKLRAAGNQLGGGMAGGAAGQIIGGALTRGRAGGVLGGGVVGGIAGTVAGTNRAQNKGHFKPQKKS